MINQYDSFDGLRGHLNREVRIGTDTRTGRDVFVPLKELTETSAHVIGAAGSGKTRWLMNFVNEFVAQDMPFGLISPHPDLFDHAVTRLRQSAIRQDRIIILDPADERFHVGFNPLLAVADPADAASLALESVLKAWSARSFDETPRLESVLRGMFRILAENRLTLLESLEFLSADAGEFRAALLRRVDDPLLRADWAEYERIPRVDKLTLLESSRNRLRRFLNPRLRMMFGQSAEVLDFRRLMDEGYYLLVNLGSLASSPETQRLLGALVLGAAYHAAKTRDPVRRRHWFLVVDECGQFLSRDMANSLDELRKFGCTLLAAHQRLSQLESEDAQVLSALLTNARLRAVFGGLERRDAERLARELFTGQVRGDKIKHQSYATKFRPIQGTFEVHGDTWGSTEGDSEGTSWSTSASESFGFTEGAGYQVTDQNRHSVLDDDDIIARSASQSRSETFGSSTSGSSSRQYSRSTGHSRSIVPVTVHEEFREETGRTYWSVEEQYEEFTAQIHGLPKRQALVRLYNGPVVAIRTPDIEPYSAAQAANERFKTRTLEACRFALPTASVANEIEDRRRAIAALVESTREPRLRQPIRSFRE